ncbi:MAG: hypothetical protein ABIJ75_07910 [Actinomycetota bacterium]
MTTTTTTETPAETIIRLRGLGWDDERILSGLGHPGYGAEYASRVVARVLAVDPETVHEAIYGETS